MYVAPTPIRRIGDSSRQTKLYTHDGANFFRCRQRFFGCFAIGVYTQVARGDAEDTKVIPRVATSVAKTPFR